MTVFYLPRDVAINSAGQPYAGALLNAYRTGTNIPLTFYATPDFEPGTELTNPIVADANGLFPAMYQDGTYDVRIVLTDSQGVLIYEEPWIPASGANAAQVSTILMTIPPFAQSAAEIAAGVVTTLPYLAPDVRRYGLVPNSQAVSNNNASLMKALVAPGGSFSGALSFPNTTGTDVWYFNDLVLVHPGCHIDIGGGTLNLTKVLPTGNETNSGFLHVIRDNIIENGTIVVNFPTGVGQGTGVFLGGRANDGPWPGGLYDSLLPAPMGNITLRNLKITSNNPGGHCITALGGLQNVLIENVWIDGQSVADGFYYEFGFATSETNREDRQTSHAHNLRFENFKATNLLATGKAIECNGAYNTVIDGLYVNTAASVAAFGFGESFFYRPWVGVDDGKVAKRTVTIRDVVGKAIKGSGILIQGAGSAVNSYFGTVIPGLIHPADYIAQTDLTSAIIDGFVLNGSTGSGAGIYSLGASRIDIRNGRISTFGLGIRTSTETTHFNIENVDVLDSETFGIDIGQIADIWSPGRSSIGEITKCFIAGSGTVTASAAISIVQTQSVKIRSCRFGHLAAYDGITETTQLQAVTVGATGFGVEIDSCTTQATSAAAAAYSLASASSSSRGSTIRNPFGVVTTTGIWENTLDTVSADNGDASITYQAHRDPRVQLFATTLTGNRTVTLATTNAVAGDKLRVVRTGLGSFTLAVGSAKTIGSATAAFVDVEYNGSAWVLVAYGAL